jgi:hypothetical protein
VRGKSGYEFCKESDEGVFIDEDEIFIDENDIDSTSEFHYKTREKCPMELQRMKDVHVRQMIKEEDEGLLNMSNTLPKHSFDLKKKVLPRKKIVRFRIKSDEAYNKQTMLFAVKKELCDILEEIIHYNDSVITDFFLTFNEKNYEENKFRKARTKKVYTILEEVVKKMKFQWYLNSYIMYPLFFSTQKEYDVNSLFPYLGSGKHNTFVDGFFSTGNFCFFLNLKKNVINILNLPVYPFYRCIRKGNAEKIYYSINLLPYRDDIKDKFEDYKKELNRVLPQYEKNMNDDELELKVASYFYYPSKGANKQTIKFRNKEVISLFNNYVSKIEADQEIKDFYPCSLIKKTQMLYSFEYDKIATAYDRENVIIFIDVLQQLMNYYIKIIIDPKVLYDFFISAKGLVLLIVPNNYIYRMMFKE